MEGPLQPPPLEVVSAVQSRLRERDIDLPDEVVAVVIAGLAHYLPTLAGVQYVSNLLGLQWRSGTEDVEYHRRDGYGQIRESIPANQLGFVEGIFYNGEPLSKMEIVMTPREQERCDDCGIVSFCSKSVWDDLRHRVVSYCNHCLIQQESSELRDKGQSGLCNNCPSKDCPNNQERLVA